MASIDISVEIEISGAAPADVASVMFDPAREPQWIAAVTGVEVLDPALAPGARVVHRGKVMGRELSWTTQVESVHFPHVLTLQITDGPFAGSVQYHIQRSGDGSQVRVRNVGDPTLPFVPAALVAGPMRTAMAADLERLKALVQGERQRARAKA
jgi:uncharacterized membrane protein